MNPTTRTLAFLGFGMFAGQFLAKDRKIGKLGSELQIACHHATAKYPHFKWDNSSIRKIAREIGRMQNQGWVDGNRTVEAVLAYISMGLWPMVLQTKNERVKDLLRPVLLKIKEVQDAITPEISDRDFRLAEIKIEQLFLGAA